MKNKNLKPIGSVLKSVFRGMRVVFASIIILSLLLCIGSFFFWKYALYWMSDLLLAIAAGLVSGLVLYCLTNRRNALQAENDLSYTMLDELRAREYKVEIELFYYSKYRELICRDEQELKEYSNTLLDLYQKVVDQLLELPDKLFAEFGIDPEENELLDVEQLYKLFENTENQSEIDRLTDLIKKYIDNIKACQKAPTIIRKAMKEELSKHLF